MKPRKQPLKRAELKRATPIHRDTPLRSSGPVKARKGRSAGERRCRNLLPVRSGGLCEIQVPGHCVGRASVASHRKRRSQSSRSEKWSPTNLLHGCLPCEVYLTKNGADPGVRSRGWTVHPSVSPKAVPVLRRGEWVWLFEGGTFEPADLSEIAEWVLGTETTGGAA